MGRRQAFKMDESFLEKLAMGAVAARQVYDDLRRQGHNPIELERGSMGFKAWKRIKIKRIRVPDILCVSCGRKVDSRAKTSFELSMSHSLADPDRGWDSGFDDHDYVAIVVCQRAGDRPVDWRPQELVQYASVQDLRSAQAGGRATVLKPKGAEEGFEARIKWPTAIAGFPGMVTEVGPQHVKYRREADNRVITARLSRQGVNLTPLVTPGAVIVRNQVLAAVVPVARAFACSRGQSHSDYVSMLGSPSLTQRYAAAKALSCFPAAVVREALFGRLEDDAEHIYVRIEAAATLARLGIGAGGQFISRCLRDAYLHNRLEAVIVLGEIADEASCHLLMDVLLDGGQHPEIRAGAAWALGETGTGEALAALVQSFGAVDEGIRIEAARALARLAPQHTPQVVEAFCTAVPLVRPGIAWALSRGGQVRVSEMLPALKDDDARHWVAYVLGTQDPQRYLTEIEQLRTQDPQVYFAVTVLWKIMTNWVFRLEEF